uniref:Uncharacterized protein n=1 Tax=Oryza meridionalis TaxID=40149 RepID=A0A0E0E1I3_9ORYZ
MAGSVAPSSGESGRRDGGVGGGARLEVAGRRRGRGGDGVDAAWRWLAAAEAAVAAPVWLTVAAAVNAVSACCGSDWRRWLMVAGGSLWRRGRYQATEKEETRGWVWTRCRRLEMGDDDSERRHGWSWAASWGGMADDHIWPARQRRRSARRPARRVEARPVAAEAGTARGGAAGGGRPAWLDEARLTVDKAGLAR